MPCHPLPGGGFICSSRPRRKPCSEPGCTRWGEYLCDYELAVPIERAAALRAANGDGKREEQVRDVHTPKTCDRPLCASHRHRVGPERDLCGPHFRLANKQMELL